MEIASDEDSDDHEVKRHRGPAVPDVVWDLVLDLLGKHPDIRDLASLPHAPSQGAIKMHLHRLQHPEASSSSATTHDYSSLLNEQGELVVVGYILYLLSCHRAVQLKTIRSFVADAFALQPPSKQWASNFMSRHGFAKHKPASFPISYAVHNTLDLAIDWVARHRADLAAAHARGWLFAIDQISFFCNGVVSHTFSPVGGYVVRRAGGPGRGRMG
jgi:hypothetical protein